MKPKRSSGKARRGGGSARRAKGNKFQKITGGEVHGRAGESLPTREHAMVGQEQDWKRADDERSRISQPTSKTSGGRGRKQNQIVDIEYEHGPGSRFQIEGRGPRSKRQNKGD
jgi:hypothetical protein